ncbi:growth-regulating factor 1-like [Mercurialis annua]|uniref:growth-regulating factor 1-like n=1 Tax=Mercurialis annua TaxID=3986 RepID=UPI00215EE364|nr:growth-regulating factor 1-like [Mercurialis annua]
MMSGASRFPFTASQWQELEHQALIYKYMVSGIPIPSDLLFTIKRSCLVDSSLSSKLFPRQTPHIGWNCFQMGLGRKIDPEPGRCRRTDGKKWRCSKEAYPDSKYCERHMHRGKNRSRKPVEAANQTATIDPIIPATVSSMAKNHSAGAGLLTPPSHSLSLLSSDQSHHQNQLHYSAYNSSHTAHLNHHFLSSSRENSTPLLFDSAGSCSLTNSDYRNAYGLKEEVDEHAFFSESSGSVRSLNDPWQFTPLTMSSSSSSSSSNQRSFLNNEYSYLQLHSLNDQEIAPKHEKQYNHHQQSYFLGMKNEREQHGEPQKTVHRFFDELPHKNKDSWLDLDDKTSTSSTTRLSISIPSSSHEFPIFNSRTHNDG